MAKVIVLAEPLLFVSNSNPIVARLGLVVLPISINFYGFFCICIYFLYICHVFFNPLILIFMRNTLILGHFFDFLNEQDLFAPYLRNAMTIGKRCPTFLQTLFFRFRPDIWITGAFSWERDLSNDWRSINKLWLTRLDNLKSENSLDD